MDAFEFRLEFIPYGWKGPTVDVLDTAETVVTKLKVLELELDPVLIYQLTKLILSRKDKEL
jgi:hypothetical protein